MGHFQKKALKLLGDCWMINMIHWSGQPLLLEELLFSYTLQLKCKQKFDQKCEKKEILIFTSISRVSSVTITNTKKYYFISVFCFLSIILKKMLKICNIVNHFKVIITVSLKKSCFSTFNFVNKVEMYILPFEIFHRNFVCLRDYAIFILMNLSTCPQNGYFVVFFVLSKR